MKYSESEIDKKIKNISSSKSRNINKAIMYLKFFGVTVIIVMVLTVCFGIAGAMRGLIDSAPELNELDLMPYGLTTNIYDSDGKKIQEITSFDTRKEYIKSQEIPKNVKNAFIAAEDPRFYEHKGIDLKALMKAVYSGITNKEIKDDTSYTITQKLLKNQLFGGGEEKTFFARFSKKIQEECIVIEFENKVDKDKILEYYLNTIILAKNTVGVESASRWYFDKGVSELNLSEAAVLAAIGGSPSKCDPVNNQEENSQRRKIVLKSMLDEGYIKEDEYEDALGDDVYERIKKINEGKFTKDKIDNSYYVDAVVENVVDDLMGKLGYSETQAYNAIYRDGLKIYTCMDSGIQSICDDVINDDKYYPDDSKEYLSYHLTIENSVGDQKEYSEKDIKTFIDDNRDGNDTVYYNDRNEALNDIESFKKEIVLSTDKITDEDIKFIKQPQASFVIMEQDTGKVAAIVGGRESKSSAADSKSKAADGNSEDFDDNRAVKAKRQPGTVFSILSTYLPALDTCGITLSNVEDDAPYHFPGTTDYIKKWDGSDYKGLTNIRDAIINSDNIVSVKTLEKVSTQTGYDYLMDLGFSTLVDIRQDENGETKSDRQFPLAYGKITDGVTNLELTAAYAGIAGGGQYIKPSFYTKVVDKRGNLIIYNEPEKKRIMKETTSWLLTDTMRDAINSEECKDAKFTDIGMSQAGKEGITENNTDCWFEGFTPYYTAGIWTGYDSMKSGSTKFSGMRMWKDIMEKVHKYKELSEKDFDKPSDIVSCDICTKCGLKAMKGLCDKAEDGDDIRTEYFAEGTAPKEYCKCHIRYKDTESGKKKILLQKDESGYKSKTKDTPYIIPK